MTVKWFFTKSSCRFLLETDDQLIVLCDSTSAEILGELFFRYRLTGNVTFLRHFLGSRLLYTARNEIKTVFNEANRLLSSSSFDVGRLVHYRSISHIVHIGYWWTSSGVVDVEAFLGRKGRTQTGRRGRWKGG